MSFRDFQFPGVVEQFGLNLVQADMFATTPPGEVSPDLADRIDDGVELAGNNETEKAKSEFVVAPILQELRRRFRREFALFSGVAFDVDPIRGLNGVCDFLIARSPIHLVPTAPLLAIVQVKNDTPRSGLGQCIAAMVAVREYNARTGKPQPAVYGATTTGLQWRFAKLVESELLVDNVEYQIADLGKILGILASIVRKPAVG